jgi:hypothetical protein
MEALIDLSRRKYEAFCETPQTQYRYGSSDANYSFDFIDMAGITLANTLCTVKYVPPHSQGDNSPRGCALIELAADYFLIFEDGEHCMSATTADNCNILLNEGLRLIALCHRRKG